MVCLEPSSCRLRGTSRLGNQLTFRLGTLPTSSSGTDIKRPLGEILPQHVQNRPQNRTRKLQRMFHVKHPLHRSAVNSQNEWTPVTLQRPGRDGATSLHHTNRSQAASINAESALNSSKAKRLISCFRQPRRGVGRRQPWNLLGRSRLLGGFKNLNLPTFGDTTSSRSHPRPKDGLTRMFHVKHPLQSRVHFTYS